MDPSETLYILGGGAIGLPLAAFLTRAGRNVIAVRTSRGDVAKHGITVRVQSDANRISTFVETVSLSQVTHLTGILVIAVKSYANQSIVQALKDKIVTGPIIILQNGLGVEKLFRESQFSPIFRCILYATSQAVAEQEFIFNPIKASPIGVVEGDDSALGSYVEALSTDAFPFRPEANIQREIWKKAIINSIFNSICPLLEVDNGVFARQAEAADLAREMVQECITLTDRLNIDLGEEELMEQILQISKGSQQLISTLQDIRNGRQTEIESLNLEIARVAASMTPSLKLPRVEFLGKMVLAKSREAR